MCLNELFEPVITQCAHVYCRRCIETVIAQARKSVAAVTWMSVHSPLLTWML